MKFLINFFSSLLVKKIILGSMLFYAIKTLKITISELRPSSFGAFSGIFTEYQPSVLFIIQIILSFISVWLVYEILKAFFVIIAADDNSDIRI